MSIKPFILSYSYIFLFCLHLQLKSVYDQQLTTGVSHLGILKKSDSLASGNNMGVQAIITSYQFHCCGNVTAWQTYVELGGNRHEGAYDIAFQV